MAKDLELVQGDGWVNLLPGQVASLSFKCRDCGCSSSVAIVNGSQPNAIDCNEERQCPECEKKTLVRMLRESGTMPEEKLLAMTRDQLLSLREDER